MLRSCGVVIVALFIALSSGAHAASFAGPPTPRRPPAQPRASRSFSLHESLSKWFALIRNNDFEGIFQSDAEWVVQVANIKKEPIFRQERDLASKRQLAEREFYTGDRYAALASYALKEPKSVFLEQRTSGDLIELYYKLAFLSPQASPRIDPTAFVRERIVRLSINQNRQFVRFDMERGYDVLWAEIPREISWVGLEAVPRGVVVGLGCIGTGDFEGTIQIGSITEALRGGGGCERTDRTAEFIDRPLDLRQGSPVIVTAKIRFGDGHEDSVEFAATIPGTYVWVRASAPRRRLAFEEKAEQLSAEKVVSQSVSFRRITD